MEEDFVLYMQRFHQAPETKMLTFSVAHLLFGVKYFTYNRWQLYRRFCKTGLYQDAQKLNS